MIPIGDHERVKSFFTELLQLGKLGKKSRVVRKQFGSSNKTEKELDFCLRIRNSSFQIFDIYRKLLFFFDNSLKLIDKRKGIKSTSNWFNLWTFPYSFNERLVQVHFTITDDSFNFVSIFHLIYWIYQSSLREMEWKKNSCHLFDVFSFL